jgi:pimeloyl-ACP methyl ester carboxylesterase
MEDATPPAQVVDTAFGPVEVLDHGEGPALVTLHGAMGGSDQSWILARALAGEHPGRRIIALSRPGYLGTRLAGREAPEQQADLVAALLDQLDVRDASVAAVSAGGPSAIHFAARYAERCRGLVLVSACTERLETTPQTMKRMRRMRGLAALPGLGALMRHRMRADPDKAAARAISDPVLRSRTLADPVAGPLLAELQSSVTRSLGRRLPGSLNDIELFAALPQLPLDEVRAPTLVVHAVDDPVVPVSHADDAVGGLQKAERLRLDGGGHFCLFTHLHQIRAAAARVL